MHDHAGTYSTIAQLAADTGMTPRNLQYLFKKHPGVSPKEYWLSVKFHAVREEILREDPDTSIAEIALKHGFYHAGYFSAVYKSFFGETPGQTRDASHF